MRHGDTLGAPQAIGTFGSRSAGLGGSALARAAMDVREKGRRLAAQLLEASPDDVEPVRGGFQVRGVPERRRSAFILSTGFESQVSLSHLPFNGLARTG